MVKIKLEFVKPYLGSRQQYADFFGWRYGVNSAEPSRWTATVKTRDSVDPHSMFILGTSFNTIWEAKDACRKHAESMANGQLMSSKMGVNP